MARKVPRMETAATSSGTNARKEPNTNASTTRDPKAPTSVSRRTPAFSSDAPDCEASSSRSSPTRTSVPAGSRRSRFSLIAFPCLSLIFSPPWGGAITGANVVRHQAAVSVVRVGDDARAGHTGDAAERLTQDLPDAGAPDRRAFGQGHDQLQGVRWPAVAVLLLEDRHVGLIARLAREREVL